MPIITAAITTVTNLSWKDFFEFSVMGKVFMAPGKVLGIRY
jgi:hypothetical protein